MLRLGGGGDDAGMTTMYFAASNVDGFIADPEHSLPWLLAPDVDTRPDGYARFIEESVGVLAKGSTTYLWNSRSRTGR